MARLPQPGGDAGNWGAILNDYLSQAHAPDGNLKPDTVTAAIISDGAIATSHLSNTVQSSLAKAETAYQKPTGGVPLSDLRRADFDAAYATTAALALKPSRRGGISDNAASLPVFNVLDYGAVADVKWGTNLATTAGSTTVTSPALIPFTGNRTIVIYGAGASGGTLITTVTCVVSGTGTLGIVAGTTLAGTGRFAYGTDSTAGFQAAINAATVGASSSGEHPGATGAQVVIPPGVFMVGNLVRKANLLISGGGIRNTALIPIATSGFVFGTSGLSNTVRMANSHLRDFTIGALPQCVGLLPSRSLCGGIDEQYTTWGSTTNIYLHNLAGVGISRVETYDHVTVGVHIMYVGTDASTPGLLMADGTASAADACHDFGMRIENCPVMLRVTCLGGTHVPFDNQFVGCKFEWHQTAISVAAAGIIIESTRGLSFVACGFAIDDVVVGGVAYPLLSVGNSVDPGCTVTGLVFDSSCTFNAPASGGAAGTAGFLATFGPRAIDPSLRGQATAVGYENSGGVAQPIITSSAVALNMDGFTFYGCQAPLFNGSALTASGLRSLETYARAATTALQIFGNSRLLNPVIVGASGMTSLLTAISMSNGSEVIGARLSTLLAAYFFSGSGSVVVGTQVSTVTTTYSGSAGYWGNNSIDDVPTRSLVLVASSGTAQTISDITVTKLTDITLTSNCTLTFPTALAGKDFRLVLRQDAIGSRTVTWPVTVKWAGGVTPTLTTAVSKADVFRFTSDGTNWLGVVVGQNF